MNNIIDASSLVKDMKIRYIIDESFGSSNNEFNTSWVEIQAFDINHNNVALGKNVISNFEPMLDVTGQSPLNTIVNGQITQREWVSCNIAIIDKLPARVIIDLQDKHNDISKLYFYHGWWTERSYKNKIYVAEKLMDWKCVYDYRKDGPIFESINHPLIIKLK